MSCIIFSKNGLRIDVEIANGIIRQTFGFAFRHTTECKGLLFPFNKPKKAVIWMWGMRFSIDTIWIRGAKILHVEHSLPPSRTGVFSIIFPFFLPRYSIDDEVDGVLEVKAGFCRENNVQEGDLVQYDL